MRGGGENKGKWREMGGEGESKGSNCNTKSARSRGTEEREKGVKKGVCGEHWLI